MGVNERNLVSSIDVVDVILGNCPISRLLLYFHLLVDNSTIQYSTVQYHTQ